MTATTTRASSSPGRAAPVREAHGVPTEAQHEREALRGVVPAVAELRERHGRRVERRERQALRGIRHFRAYVSLRHEHPRADLQRSQRERYHGYELHPERRADLFLTTKAQKLRRVRWATKRLVPGWTFDLTPFGIRDGRAVELIGGRSYVLDGYDGRSDADRRKYAVYVFDVS